MKGVARISFQGGGLFLPVKTPYDRELFFEHVNRYAKRHGQVHVELNRLEWNVSLSGSTLHVCSACNQAVDALIYALGARNLCAHCARRTLR